DLVANALAGGSSVTGDALNGPVNGYGNQTYHTVGLYAAICALAARRAGQHTAEMQHVDLSAHESLVTCTEQVLMEWFFPEGGWPTSIAPRQGSLHWTNAYEVYPSRDGHGIMITAALRFVDVLLPWLIEEGAAQELADPVKYPDALAMIRDLPNIMRVLREWIATRDAKYLFFEGQRRHQPMGIVWNIAEAVESPQIAAREYLSEQVVAGFGMVRFPGRFFRTSADGAPPGPPTRVDAGRAGWLPRGAVPTSSGRATTTAPLAGVRILDFTHVLAGPFGTRVLGDLGADVIKVGTAVRAGGANTPDHPYYVCWNRNKRSVSVNMASEKGRAVAQQLAANCDVIIENFSAGVLKRWGLDREGLVDVNPGVSVVSMGGMGQTGPWRDFVTFAPTIHALSGLTYLTNPRGRHDLGYGFSLTDHLSGLAGALASLEALEYRARTGEGLSVDLSQYELGLGLLGPAILDYFANGTNPEPVGNRHPFGQYSPHGIYSCAGDDKWVAIAVRGDDQWQGLCRAIGDSIVLGDARFATHAARLANQDALDALVAGWTQGRDRFEVASLLQASGISAGAVQDAGDLTHGDPQLEAREFFGTLSRDGGSDYGFDRFPALFNGERPAASEGVHSLGADTFEVATDLLGLSDDEVAGLLAEGVLS
ncbi:MAG: CoA transferase, partial [Anaerolineaceae bacterium]